MIVQLSDADLLARMKNFEDHLVERKTVADEGDWKKTVVAFANSAPAGVPAVLYIGVRNNGEIETPQKNLDDVQRKFNARMAGIYPRVGYIPKIINDNGQQALAVIIPQSELRPHFAGLAYVRRGSETREASEEQFVELIAQRNSKAAQILQWKGKNVTVFVRTGDSEIPWPSSTSVVDCNQFYVTLEKVPHEPASSFPLSRVEINFDNLKRRLQLEVLDANRNPWDVQLERHVRQVLLYSMTHQGQQLLGALVRRGRIECVQQFMPEIPLETQHKQMEIAVRNEIVGREQEASGLHKTYYLVNQEYLPVLKKVLPDILK